MESNWRFNTWNIGLSYSTIRLSALAFTGFGVEVYICSDASGLVYWNAQYAPGFGLTTLLGPFPLPAGAGNFPYGVVVTPDH